MKRVIFSASDKYEFSNVDNGMLIVKNGEELGVYTGFELGENIEGDYLIELALEFQDEE